ncbi:MAG: EVE domain-containing protein [Caldilineae bacterium]|nr:MAG: EVE domain-containing protein [Caldilineae bacterium]
MKIMGAHIFLVGKDNFEICRRQGVYGCVKPNKEWNRAEIIAGMQSIVPGDLVFFYVKNKGVYGLWKTVGTPYYDDTQIWPDNTQKYPYRFSFEPTVGSFPKPISLNDILDLRDKGRIWTFDLNPVQQKNQYKITMSEAKELLRLLLRNNPLRTPPTKIPDPYTPSQKNSIEVEIPLVKGNKIKYEGWLNAWLMQSLAAGKFKDLFGDYQEFLNLVPTTFNKVMDIFLTHIATVDSIEILYKYTCIELKKDRATKKDLTQILRYEDWLARKLAYGDHEMIQSILIAKDFTKEVTDYVKNRQQIEEKTIRLLSYQVTKNGQEITFYEQPL